jgi:uncharacterized cupredoxin-like copper-binding protein
MKLVIAAAAALFITASLVATPKHASADATISVSLDEFSVSASPASAPPGTNTFNVSNNGAILHDFYVIQTNLAPGSLPVDQNTAAVDLAQLNVIAQTQDVQPGGSDSTSASMAAGSYVLICNLPSHYEAGMYRGFSVAQAPANTSTPVPGQPTATLAPGETPGAVPTDGTGGAVDGPTTGYGPSSSGSSGGPWLLAAGLAAFAVTLGGLALRRISRAG